MKKIYTLVFFFFVLFSRVQGIVVFGNDTGNFITTCFPKENSCFFHFNQTILDFGGSSCYQVASFRHGCTFFLEGYVAVKVTLTPEMCAEMTDNRLYRVSLSPTALVLVIDEYELGSNCLRCRRYFPTELIYGYDEWKVRAHNNAAKEEVAAAERLAEQVRRSEEQERLRRQQEEDLRRCSEQLFEQLRQEERCQRERQEQLAQQERYLREQQEFAAEQARLRRIERRQRQRAMQFINGPEEEEKILEQEFARMRLQRYVCGCKKCR